MSMDVGFNTERMEKDEKGRWVRKKAVEEDKPKRREYWARGLDDRIFKGYWFDEEGVLRCGECGQRMVLNPGGDVFCHPVDHRCELGYKSVWLDGVGLERKREWLGYARKKG